MSFDKFARDGLSILASNFVNSSPPPSRVALYVDEVGSVPLWLEGGGIAFKSLAPSARAQISNQIAATFSITPVSGVAQRAPLVIDEAGNIPLWLENGLVGAKGFTASLMGALTAPILQSVGLEVFSAPSPVRIPLIKDSAGNFPLWLENGLIGAQGLSPSLMKKVAAAVTVDPTSILAAAKDAGDKAYAPRNAPLGARWPIATDGRSLSPWYGKLAKRRQSGTGKLTIMLFGDSHHEKRPVPQMLANLLYAQLTAAGGGWISVNANLTTIADDFGALDGATFTKSGWTTFDASTTFPVSVPAFGCSHDGFAISTTEATATASFTTTVACTELHLFYPKTTGSFRYRVDGGAWTTITGDGSNALAAINIVGLALASHTLDIDTSVNTAGATAALFGLYFTTTNAAGGVEVLKCGNGGLEGRQMLAYVNSYVAPIAAALAPDLIVIASWGANDARRYNDPTIFASSLPAIVAAFRSVLPNVGFIFVAPAPLGGTFLVPLATIRDNVMSYAITAGVEALNLYDCFSSYAVESAAGQYYDQLHFNNVGGFRSAAITIDKFLIPSSFRN